MKTIGLMLALALLAPVVLAQDTVTDDDAAKRIIKEGTQNSRVMDHLDHLINKIGPRLTSSDNLTKACEWAVEKFKSFGLEARMEEWGTFPVGFNRGPWGGVMKVGSKRTRLTICTPCWTPGTDGPETGNAVLAPTSEEEIDVEKLKGAWVLQSRRPPRSWRAKLNEAYDEAKIKGIITRTRELIITAGRYRISWDNLPKRVTVEMVTSDYDKIVEHITNEDEVSLTISIKNEFKKGPIKLYNVIADLKGTEKPDEYVVVGGHIDSWDGARGALDNGTGCATTIEAARILTTLGLKPKRTIRFMLWSGEEQGLLGSNAFVKKHKEDVSANYSACLVHDGGTNYCRGITAMSDELVGIFEKIFDPVKNLDEDMPFTIKKSAIPNAFGGSDHTPFYQAGVPGFFWTQSGKSNYGWVHHTQHDLFDQAVPKYQRNSSIVIAVGAYGIANLDGKLPREGMRARGAARGPRRMLGVNLDGTTITNVMEDSAADKAGLQEGDVILQLGDVKVESRSDLTSAKNKAKKKTTIIIERKGEKMTLPIQFDR